MPIIYRASSGSDLSADQIDGNFHALDDRVTAAEAAIPVASVGIASISQASAGAPLDITLTNATVLHFTLPRPLLRFLPWQPHTFYSAGQFIVDPGETAIYEVALAHTSAATFDPGASAGSAGDIYELLLRLFQTSFPVVTASIASDGTWSPVSSDAFKFWLFEAACAIVIPSDALLDVPIGTEFALHANTAADVTVEGGVIDSSGDVAIDYHASFSAKLLGQYATATVKKKAANRWALLGLLAAA